MNSEGPSGPSERNRLIMISILREYFPSSSQKGIVKLKSNYFGTICAIIVAFAIVYAMCFILNVYMHFQFSKKILIDYQNLVISIVLFIISIFAQTIFYMLRGYTKFDRQMIDYLGHFLWVQKLYLKDVRNRICDSVDAHYEIDENNHVVIGLYPHGLTYTDSTQKLESDLASLFNMWDLIDVRVYADHTDYVFDTRKLKHIDDQNDSYRFA